ncbi:MAG: hypothetical protein JWR42_2160 [Marmoricola sp.]|nr:hypothetical protein [Marmoricola sp.]
MKNQDITSGTPMWSGLLAPVAAHVVGDVRLEQARARVEVFGTSARNAIVPTDAFGTVTGSHPCGPPV